VSLHQLARGRAAAGRPVRVGLIGAGKFGSMFLNQVPGMAGVEVSVIADLDPERARHACRTVGWDAARIARTKFVASGAEACTDPEVEVVVEATGSPPAGIAHARAATAAKKHIVMVNVEADVLAGPLLAEEAREAGVVYSLAYGDQPALTCELVDWARACGFEVIAAGKGTKYLPAYHKVTPDDVWAHYGLTPENARRGGMNPQMFNSFLDGTKSAIEMAAIANATGLAVPQDGLLFPPCGVDDLPQILRGTSTGGVLDEDGMVEVVSSLERDGRPVFAVGTLGQCAAHPPPATPSRSRATSRVRLRRCSRARSWRTHRGTPRGCRRGRRRACGSRRSVPGLGAPPVA
jgi:predicted homoserine dehydrogenase-like protein